MAELTINNLIKIIIAVVVLIAVILGVYLSFNNYIIPYFKGFDFGMILITTRNFINRKMRERK